MARGRKKIKIRDFRLEKIRPSEAAKFLNINESYFYQLVREGYINRHDDGVYYLGEVIQGFFNAFNEKGYSIEKFLSGLGNF